MIKSWWNKMMIEEWIKYLYFWHIFISFIDFQSDDQQLPAATICSHPHNNGSVADQQLVPEDSTGGFRADQLHRLVERRDQNSHCVNEWNCKSSRVVWCEVVGPVACLYWVWGGGQCRKVFKEQQFHWDRWCSSCCASHESQRLHDSEQRDIDIGAKSSLWAWFQ